MSDESSQVASSALAALRQRKGIIWVKTDQDAAAVAEGLYQSLDGYGARPGVVGDTGATTTIISPMDYTDTDLEWEFGMDFSNLLLDPGYLVFAAPEGATDKLQTGIRTLLEDIQGPRTAKCRAVFVISADDPPQWLQPNKAIVLDEDSRFSRSL